MREKNPWKYPYCIYSVIRGEQRLWKKILKNQGLDPVLVNFFEGLIGPGGLVWGGNSSPWGWEWGVCLGGRTGFLMVLCGGWGRGWSEGWCRASSRWRSLFLLGPALRGGVVPDFSGCGARLGDILSNLFVTYKGTGYYQSVLGWVPGNILP